MSDTWTARYRGRLTALLIDAGDLVEVDVVKVLKTLVVVRRESEELRYAADHTGHGFQHALRETNGATIYGRCPMLALEGDRIVDIVRAEKAEADRRAARADALRRRLDPLFVRADLDALERVALALEEPRRRVDADGRWPELTALIGGDVLLSESQLTALWDLRNRLRRLVAEARQKGFEEGTDLLSGLNSGRFTPETFEEHLQHQRYHIDLEVERSRE